MFLVNNQNAMHYGNAKEVIDGIHGTLTDGQGLVEVKSGITKKTEKYIYSIVK